MQGYVEDSILDLAKNLRFIPIKEDQDTLTIEVSANQDIAFIKNILYFYLDKKIKTVVLNEEEFLERWNNFLSQSYQTLEDQDVKLEFETIDISKDELESPAIIFVNNFLLKAIKIGASDIHIEPYEKNVLVRMRIDGKLVVVEELTNGFYQSVLSRIKVIANMNVAEKRLPQDARFRIKISKKEIDIRVSTIPSLFGERVVLRILDQSSTPLDLEELGLSKEDYENVLNILSKPYGIILVTGPTGSGKSTSLYAFLKRLKSPSKNIITIEDPVEYQIEGISQIQVNPKVGLTFASGLRSILRQDPDIIMIGEIRDKETAEIAIQAALTGHLVLSTLHTQNALSSITRLFDIGIEPFLIASSVEGLIAQRLVRKICPYCKTSYKPSSVEIKELGLKEGDYTFYKGLGCEHCMQSGYKGRIGLFEVINVDDKLKSIISQNPSWEYIKSHIQYKSLLDDGIEKILNGITTIEEVLQVCKIEENQ
jgi:general secretion pathway protein E